MKLSLSKIIADPALQARAGGVDAEVAREYGIALKGGEVLPPVVVFGPGEDGNYFLGDGFHRLAGAKLEEIWEIDAQIRPGGRREALLHSLGANAAHGLRRTQADKRKAILTLLEDPEWSQWSDRVIAGVAKVDHKTVGTLRQGLSTSTGEFPSCQRQALTTANADHLPKNGEKGEKTLRRGKDGRSRKLTLVVDIASRKLLPVPENLPPRAPDFYADFHRQFNNFLAQVPEEQRHLICGQLRNLADDSDPEFQEQQRLLELERQEKLFGKKGKKR